MFNKKKKFKASLKSSKITTINLKNKLIRRHLYWRRKKNKLYLFINQNELEDRLEKLVQDNRDIKNANMKFQD